jgi:hypothetical protein
MYKNTIHNLGQNVAICSSFLQNEVAVHVSINK